MLLGYARVSTFDQTLTLQQDALTQAGNQGVAAAGEVERLVEAGAVGAGAADGVGEHPLANAPRPA